MSANRTLLALRIDGLEPRLPLSTMPGVALPSPVLLPADVRLQAFSAAYLSRRGGANYNSALDFNGNGFIGQGDARPILQALAPLTPREPQRFEISLAPGDQVLGHHSANSGGVTRKTEVTVIGRTTPNSIVFTDSLQGPRANNFKFEGFALPVNSQGYFSYTIRLNDALTQTEYLAVDPFGHQTIRAFPLRRLPA